MLDESTAISIKLGATQPSDPPPDLVKALRAVEVIQGIRCPAGFRLSFLADRYPSGPGALADYPLLDPGLLDPFVRVYVLVTTSSGSPQVLMDGFITRQELTIGKEGTTITVIGEDVSVKMDLFEVSAEFQNLTDSAIATQILGQYSSLGITPSVTAPTGESAPANWVPQQNSTDRWFLQMLAARHGFLFCMQPGPSAGQNTAYWGPPITTGNRQPALTTAMGPRDNLRSLSLSYDALAPTLTYGSVLDLTQQPAQPVPVAIGSATQVPGLSQTPAIASSAASLASAPASFTSQLSTLGLRGSLLLHPGLAVADAQQLGQSKTNRSVQEVVVVEGELDTAEYGAILTAPGLVDLRGVGNRYDGTYYVKQVHHLLSLEQDQWSYLQRFILTRDGFGSTIATVQQVGGDFDQ